MARVRVRYEQAVYGSFPFWDKGYAVLAHSPGCRPEWLAGLRAACQRLGEPPAGAAGTEAMFATRLAEGPWVVVGVQVQEADDRGRPGPLAFHALFLAPREYRRIGSDPFALAGAFRRDWGPETTALPSGAVEVERFDETNPSSDERALRIASALARGRRVALESAGPIGPLARAVWVALPRRVRGRKSVATWAFGNGNCFDLLAAPRLAGLALDASYVDPFAPPESGRGPVTKRTQARLGIALAGAAAALAIGAGVVMMLRDGRGESHPAPVPAPSYPDRAAYRDEPLDPDERRAVAEALVDLAERFGVEPGEADDPTALMVRLADRLRYRGPFLSAVDLARLRAENDPDRALAWDDHVHRFAPDRPLPPDFARGPLRWQLDTLAWSFHLEDDPEAHRRSSVEVVHRLADALAFAGSARPTPLAARYPALADYARWLDRLPRR